MVLGNKISCPTCGEANKLGAPFCTSCGVKLEIYNPSSEKLCPNCGMQVNEIDNELCRYCGVNLKNAITFSETVIIPHINEGMRAKPSIFTISDETIKISLPNVQPFQINWAEINRINIIWRKEKELTLKFKYSFNLINLRESIDFYPKSFERIINLIIQYSKKKQIKVKTKVKKKKKQGSFSGCDCTCIVSILLAISLSLGWYVFDPNILYEIILNWFIFSF